MSALKNPFSKKLPVWLHLANAIIAVPILIWPIIFFSTIFFFDDPNGSQTKAYALFFAVNAYPLYLIALIVLNIFIYKKSAKTALILPFLVLLAITWFILELMNIKLF